MVHEHPLPNGRPWYIQCPWAYPTALGGRYPSRRLSHNPGCSLIFISLICVAMLVQQVGVLWLGTCGWNM